MFPNDSLISVNKSLLKAKHNSSLGSFSNIRKKMYQQLGYFFFSLQIRRAAFFGRTWKGLFLTTIFFFPFPKNIQSVFQRKYRFNSFCDRRRTCDAKHIETVFARVEKKKKAVQILCLVWRKNYQHCGVAFLSSNELKKGLLK